MAAEQPARDAPRAGVGRGRRGATLAAGGLLVGVIAASILLPCAAVGPQDADSSELVAAALTGRLAHPPGFPWFTALLELVVEVDRAAPYATLATFNALVQALAAGLLAVALGVVAGDALTGALLALGWLLWRPTLFTGTFIEVFAAHHVVVVALMLACSWCSARPTRARVFLVGLVSGLGGSHHPSIVFFAPLVLATVAREVPLAGVERTRALSELGVRAAAVVAGACVGLVPYALLPGRFARDPIHAFGHVETLHDVVRHALRLDYGLLSMNEHAALGPSAVGSLVRLSTSAPGILLAGAVAVFVILRGRRGPGAAPGRALLVGALGSWLGLLGFAAMLRGAGDGPGLALRFFPSIALGAALLGAAALGALGAQARRGLAAGALACALLDLPAAVRGADAARDGYTAVLLDQILGSVPPGAFLLLEDDALVFGAEAEQARGVRPDVTVIAVGRLDAWWTRERLVARHPFLRALDPEARAWLPALTRAAIGAGHAVAAGPRTAPPDGFVRLARGPLAQWLPAAPGDGLLSRCRALPDVLATMDPARPSWELALGWSLAGLQQRAAVDDEEGRAIGSALRALAGGDVPGARRACDVASTARP